MRLTCSGWWEQEGFGRQPMLDLQLSFSDGKVTGRGYDVVGLFRFTGYLEQDRIYLLKEYIGQHEIQYGGVNIGEGAFAGEWTSFGIIGGKWFIGIDKLANAAADATQKCRELEF